MGHRANFVIINDGRAKAFYDQWAAMACIYTFGAGPEQACEAASQSEPTDALLDWAFAEGGYLIDFDKKKAIVFGCAIDISEFEGAEEFVGDSGQRPLAANSPFEEGGLAFLKHIGPNWAGWKLVWDDHGVDAFAAHLKERGITEIGVQPDSHPPETALAVEYHA